MKFTITYVYNGSQYKTEWYGRNKDTVTALFKMWHPAVEIVSVE